MEEIKKLTLSLPTVVPVVTIRDVVMFPGMSLPLSVDRERSINAVEHALRTPGNYILAISQKDAENENPKEKDLYHFGVICQITQNLRLPTGSLKVFLQGLARARVHKLDVNPGENAWFAQVEYIEEEDDNSPVVQALMRQVLDEFDQYARTSHRVAVEGVSFLRQITDPSKLADTIASNMLVKTAQRQEILEAVKITDRLEKILKLITSEIQIMDIENKIHNKVRAQMDKNQKEYYLNEQMKAIQKELSQKDDFQKELDAMRAKIKKNGLPPHAAEEANKELDRLSKMQPFSPEATVARTYLDWLLNMPWNKTTTDVLDLKKARQILDEDHFGLEKPKERILEYLAVNKLTGALRGPVLCFAGAPGVGKTSLAKSIARAIGRKFVRMSLGGVRDESEIRGHRRTYIGSMPGRIIQGISKAKSANPVFLLDEIDKMGSDWRGDPAAALLELLDPEQNKEFTDHFLDVPFDVSKVMFITTANSLSSIPVTLRDRLEIIDFDGYTEYEKHDIVNNYLLPKQLKIHGLKKGQLEIDKDAVALLMRDYVREAGVRNLEREIGSLCRKAARKVVEGAKKVHVTKANLHEFLGVPKYSNFATEDNGVGIATGLAWTSVGGETLTIEATKLPGKGALILTGMLGNVMKESVRAALTYAQSRGYGKDVEFDKTDFHIHFPEGAIPKDGPSAGGVITPALTSLLTGLPVKKKLAMTGEVTITGRILPVGGIKEKFLAAYREGVKTILYPHTNQKDVSEIPERVRKEMTLIPVKHMDEVLPLALEGWSAFAAQLKKDSKKTATKSTKASVKKTAKKAVKKVAKKPTKKAAKKVAPKAAKKATRPSQKKRK